MTEPPRPVRLALALVPGRRLAGWQARLVDRLAADPLVTLAGRVSLPRPGTAAAGRMAPLAAIEERALAFHLPRYDTARAAALVAGLAEIEGRSPACDAILRLTGEGPAAPEAAVPTLFLRIEGEPVDRAGLACRRAAAGAADLVAVDLVEARGDGTEACLDGALYNPKFSAAATAEFVLEKALLLVERALHRRARYGPDGSDCPPIRAPAREPARLLPYLGHLGAETLGRSRFGSRMKRRREHWRLRVGRGAADTLDPADTYPAERFRYCMADPFPFAHGGRTYLFYEAHGRDGGPAWIEVAVVDGRRLVRLGEAVRTDYHLSFPFVFRDGEDIYMIPETQSVARLELWKAIEFPLVWQRWRIALEGSYPADSVLFVHRGAWWLLSNISDHFAFQEHSSELYAFRVDGPALRRIEPHPDNPVVIGSDRARNAGAPFRRDGRLFRPAQENAGQRYGRAVRLMEITRLDEEAYAEHEVCRIGPEAIPGALGLHHLGVLDDDDRLFLDVAFRG
ncbi:MAG: hypothetical protein D6688_06345 [Alphaproteobacteria bacterium]|nr:MAG: hypothetical protein D6688_06345 [Alphaproteobacteria bacterium]